MSKDKSPAKKRATAIAPRPRVAKGVRPGNLVSAEAEQVLYMLLAATAEMSALRDRVEDIARFLNRDGAALDEFLAANPRSAADEAEAASFRHSLCDAMFRILQDDLAANEADDKLKAYRELMARAAAGES